jgi:hypothetical protein
MQLTSRRSISNAFNKIISIYMVGAYLFRDKDQKLSLISSVPSFIALLLFKTQNSAKSSIPTHAVTPARRLLSQDEHTVERMRSKRVVVSFTFKLLSPAEVSITFIMTTLGTCEDVTIAPTTTISSDKIISETTPIQPHLGPIFRNSQSGNNRRRRLP